MNSKKTIKSKFDAKSIIHQTQIIKDIYSSEDIKINPTSYFGKLLEEISNNYTNKNEPQLIFKALIINKIASSMLYINEIKKEERKKLLYRLKNDTLDFMKRTPSDAKSILWELELFTNIRDSISSTCIAEPDILIKYEDGDIGIPCKKISSENNIQKILSNAVKQIENNSCEFGIIAINLDDLLPEESILNKGHQTAATDYLYKHNTDFLNRHEHHFLKYFKSSRIIAVIVFTSVIVDIENESPKFNYAYQLTTWTIPDLKKKYKEKFNSFKTAILP